MECLGPQGEALRQHRPDLFEDAALQTYHIMTDTKSGKAFYSDAVLYAVIQTLLAVGHANPLFIANLSLQVRVHVGRFWQPQVMGMKQASEVPDVSETHGYFGFPPLFHPDAGYSVL